MKSKRHKRPLLIIAGIAIVISMLVAYRLFFSIGSQEEASLEADPVVRQFPPLVTLSLGEQFVFYPKKLKGNDAHYYVSGKDGTFWVLRQEVFQPLMAAQLGKDMKPSFEPISPKSCPLIEPISVTNDGSGNPVVIMMGYDEDVQNTVVVARKHSGKGWKDPDQLDVFDGSGHIASMLSFLDSKDRIHIVYDRDLDLRESYGIMEGHFPDKCFHAWYDGKKWNQAQSTTGRGKFYVDPSFLSELPNGKICLKMRVHPFSGFGGYEPEYVGYQLWNGSQWSSIAKELPEEAVCSTNGQPVLDYWGNSISSTRKDGTDYCLLKKRGSNTIETIPIVSKPLLKRDRSGRIIVCSSGPSRCQIRIWNGNQWTNTLDYPLTRKEKLTQILCNPDGNIFLIHEGKSQVTIQRIKMMPEDGAQDQTEE